MLQNHIVRSAKSIHDKAKNENQSGNNTNLELFTAWFMIVFNHQSTQEVTKKVATIIHNIIIIICIKSFKATDHIHHQKV
jgi:hypothetical protein